LVGGIVVAAPSKNSLKVRGSVKWAAVVVVVGGGRLLRYLLCAWFCFVQWGVCVCVCVWDPRGWTFRGRANGRWKAAAGAPPPPLLLLRHVCVEHPVHSCVCLHGWFGAALPPTLRSAPRNRVPGPSPGSRVWVVLKSRQSAVTCYTVPEHPVPREMKGASRPAQSTTSSAASMGLDAGSEVEPGAMCAPEAARAGASSDCRPATATRAADAVGPLPAGPCSGGAAVHHGGGASVISTLRKTSFWGPKRSAVAPEGRTGAPAGRGATSARDCLSRDAKDHAAAAQAAALVYRNPDVFPVSAPWYMLSPAVRSVCACGGGVVRGCTRVTRGRHASPQPQPQPQPRLSH
jgi:hypothetical protein